jgi:hypothetical protein
MVMQLKNLHLRGAMLAGWPRSRRFPPCAARSTVMQVKKPAPTGSDARRMATEPQVSYLRSTLDGDAAQKPAPTGSDARRMAT